MMYSNTGEIVLGMSAIRSGLSTCTEYVNEQPSRSKWHTPKAWKESTVGELIEQEMYIPNPRGKTQFSYGRLAEHELAFKVRHQYQIDPATPCEIGSTGRATVLRIGSTEYRETNGRLDRRMVA